MPVAGYVGKKKEMVMPPVKRQSGRKEGRPEPGLRHFAEILRAGTFFA
ncbi:hypothetical protein QF002_001382 [Paraburkholderia youngii]